jgi:hypothetical protein
MYSDRDPQQLELGNFSSASLDFVLLTTVKGPRGFYGYLPSHNFVDVFKNIFIRALKPMLFHSPGSKDYGPPRPPSRLDQRAQYPNNLHEGAGPTARISCSVHPGIPVVTCINNP